MKKFMGVLFVCAMFCLAAGCGDESTVIEGPVPVTVDGSVVTLSPYTCTNNAQCELDEVCEEVDDFESSQGKTVPVSMCIFGCTAQLKTTVEVNTDGTSVTVISKVPRSDTCQRDGSSELTCDMTKDSATFRQCIASVAKPAEEDPPVVEPNEPVAEGDTEITCCFVGKTIGLYGQFGWSEATIADADAWGAARDLTISVGCFGSTVRYTDVFGGVFYTDLTNDFHTGVKEHDAAISWVGWQYAMPNCTVGATVATVGPFMQGKGWPFWLEE